jgi:flavin reductase (DIM6/NTAB) family NADH-FMN oxidoreductase RutF
MEKENIPLHEAARLLYPRITVVVTSSDSEGEPNAAPYSWVMPVSFSPPMVAVGIQARETRTIRNIRKTRGFVVNVVTKDWAHEAVACEAKGVENKLGAVGLKTTESEKVDAPTVARAKIVLECSLSEIIQPKGADHCLVVGAVVAAKKDKGVGTGEIVMHMGGEWFVLPGKEMKIERNR